MKLWTLGLILMSGAVLAQSQDQPARVKIGSVQQAKLITRVEPVYPPRAAKKHIVGDVELTYSVDETGHVTNIEVVKGHPLLVPAAVDALRQWIYRPTLLNGDPIVVQNCHVTIAFSPPDAHAKTQRRKDGVRRPVPDPGAASYATR